MGKRFFVAGLLAVLCFARPVGAGAFREVFTLRWGGGAEYRETPERRYGPPGFAVLGQRLLLPDAARSRVDEYDLPTGRLVRQASLRDPESPDGRTQFPGSLFSPENESMEAVAVAKPDASSVSVRAPGVSFVYRHPGLLGAVELLALDGERCLLRTEEIVPAGPLRTREIVLALDRQGQRLGGFALPPVRFAHVPRNLRVQGDSLYCLLAAPDGLHLFRLPLAEAAEGRFPDEWFAPSGHGGENLPEEPQPPAEKREMLRRDEQPISRGQIMALAVPYQEVSWTAGPANISGGVIVLPDGAYIRTPPWVTVGHHLSVPYKWAGWTELSVFRQAVQAGKYTGDNYIDSSVQDYSWGDAYCVGLDCSGYASRAWNTARKYSTSTLPNISTALASWAELKRGDILNNAGHHVMLYVGTGPTGEMIVLEASGGDWRVAYHSHTLTELADYVPRRFNLVTEEGPPATAYAVRVGGGEEVAVCDEPGGPAVTTVSGGQLFVAGERAGEWYRLWLPYGSGYARGWVRGGAAGEFLRADPAASTVRCTGSALNVRTGPSTSYAVVTSITCGQRFGLLETQGNWARISLPASAGRADGWASLTYLEVLAGGTSGDLDGDGVADARDAALLAGCLAGTLPNLAIWTAAADLDGDGRLTAADLLRLLQLTTGTGNHPRGCRFFGR